MRFSSLTIEKQLHYLNILKILSIECKNLIKTDEMGYFTRDEILRLFNHNMTILFFYSELLYSDALIEEDEYKKVSKTIKEYEKDYDGKYRILTLEEKFAQLIKTADKRTTFKCFITVEHLRDAWQRQRGLCAYTKLPLSSEAHQLNTVSLDRVDSDKDYTDDNIQLVCVPINRMKLDMTEDRFIELCSLVTKNSKLAELPVT